MGAEMCVTKKTVPLPIFMLDGPFVHDTHAEDLEIACEPWRFHVRHRQSLASVLASVLKFAAHRNPSIHQVRFSLLSGPENSVLVPELDDAELFSTILRFLAEGQPDMPADDVCFLAWS